VLSLLEKQVPHGTQRAKLWPSGYIIEHPSILNTLEYVRDVTYTNSMSPDRFMISDFADSACINPKSRVLAHRVHLTSNGVFANYALNN
jgi:hypothetical protein